MGILLDLRLAEVSMMIRDSEKSGDHGDVDLFLAALRLALPIFAVTHAVKYVRCICEFLKWWETASDAMRMTFRLFIFTRKGPQGGNYFADRCVEETMENIRVPLGKKYQAGQNMKVETTLATLEHRVSNKANMDEMLGHHYSCKSKHWNDREVDVTKVFVETFKWCLELNLYGEGPVNLQSRTGSSVEEQTLESSGITMTPKGEQINAAILTSFSEGQERVRKYFEKFYICYRFQVRRTEADINLQHISSTVSQAQKELSKLIIQKTSCNSAQLNDLKWCTKQIIANEIEMLRPSLPKRNQPPTIDIKAGKLQLAETLVKYRTRYFRHDRKAKDRIKEEITTTLGVQTESNTKARAKELKLKFYSLDTEEKKKYQNQINYTSIVS